jgi:DNA-binding transcriptional regulator GbsR (MarR family)
LSQDRATFIERAGVVFEAEGMPRMAGRILGCLMVCTPREQSIADLMEALQASNSSISTMTRFLEDQGYVERVPRPGDRKDYFALRPGMGTYLLTGAQQSIGKLRGLFEQALAVNGKKARPELTEAIELFAFLADEYAAILDRWKKRQRKT